LGRQHLGVMAESPSCLISPNRGLRLNVRHDWRGRRLR
jgi:hypothetical protein